MATKLLIVDDDKAIADGLAAYGKKRGFDVSVAYAGDKAIDIALAVRPEVVLLDIMLPGLDGRDVMVRLNELGLTEDAIVIFTTARHEQFDRLVGFGLGAIEYETKPLHFGRLFDKIARFLEKKRSGDL